MRGYHGRPDKKVWDRATRFTKKTTPGIIILDSLRSRRLSTASELQSFLDDAKKRELRGSAGDSTKSKGLNFLELSSPGSQSKLLFVAVCMPTAAFTQQTNWCFQRSIEANTKLYTRVMNYYLNCCGRVDVTRLISVTGSFSDADRWRIEGALKIKRHKSADADSSTAVDDNEYEVDDDIRSHVQALLQAEKEEQEMREQLQRLRAQFGL